MSQLAGGGSQPKYGEELDYFLRRLETVRFQADGWQEPYESRGSRTVAWGTGGEIPPVYPTLSNMSKVQNNCDGQKRSVRSLEWRWWQASYSPKPFKRYTIYWVCQ
jgi:hypothetical protein